MLFAHRPRNRYRRRPSRLTALGKVAVTSTVTALLALGWASQASRRSDRPPLELGSESGTSPVSAPPRWVGAPGFGVFSFPESAQDSSAEVEATPERAGAPESSPNFEPTSEVGPISPPAAPAPAFQTAAPTPVSSLRIGTAPTSRTRFEHARRSSADVQALASAAPGGDPAENVVATGPAFVAARDAGRRRLSEWVDARELGLPAPSAQNAPASDAFGSRVRVDYSLDEPLTGKVFEILRQGRVERGIAIVIDPRSGRLLAYVSTDPRVLPVEHAYPAASIVKVITAAAMLEQRPDPQGWDCLYEGNKYRLSQRRLDRPKRGNRATLEEAIATSNNQCFSQWAIHGVGEPRLRRMLALFGWTHVPALGHAAGRVAPASNRYELGQLGSGLDGVRVTPLHVASLASVLTDGRLVTPHWIDRIVDAQDHALALPPSAPPERVINPRTAENLRELMVATTKRGTARRAFRTRRGIPVLGSIEVAGKTGNLNGRDPSGRYEWFFGVAPANDPKIGVVVMQVHGHLWWARSSELAANILRSVFCEGSSCRAELSARFTGAAGADGQGPVLMSDLERASDTAPRD